MDTLPQLTATRYVQPLREGGSLPAIVETEEGLFVVKFRGAGQGAAALIAELIAAALAERLGLRVPDTAIVDIVPEFGLGEPDPEIQDLLRASHGANVGLRYLDGAFNYDARAAGDLVVDPELGADIVWFDTLLTNPDRTHRNPNLLVWQRALWLIDHGTALYAHHDWPGVTEARTRAGFPLIRSHVLLGRAGDLQDADERLHGRLDDEALAAALARVPDALLMDPVLNSGFASAGAARARYLDYLRLRLAPPRAWVAEAAETQQAVRSEPPRRTGARR